MKTAPKGVLSFPGSLQFDQHQVTELKVAERGQLEGIR